MVVDTSMSGNVCKLVHSLTVTRSMSVTTTTSFLSSMVLLAVTDTIDILSLVQQTITTGQSATDTNTIQACQHRHSTDKQLPELRLALDPNPDAIPTLTRDMCNPMPFNFAH